MFGVRCSFCTPVGRDIFLLLHIVIYYSHWRVRSQRKLLESHLAMLYCIGQWLPPSFFFFLHNQSNTRLISYPDLTLAVGDMAYLIRGFRATDVLF